MYERVISDGEGHAVKSLNACLRGDPAACVPGCRCGCEMAVLGVWLPGARANGKSSGSTGSQTPSTAISQPHRHPGTQAAGSPRRQALSDLTAWPSPSDITRS